MWLRFLVKDYDGFSHCTEKKFISIDEAEKEAKRMVMDVNFVESVTLNSLLSDITLEDTVKGLPNPKFFNTQCNEKKVFPSPSK